MHLFSIFNDLGIEADSVHEYVVGRLQSPLGVSGGVLFLHDGKYTSQCNIHFLFPPLLKTIVSSSIDLSLQSRLFDFSLMYCLYFIIAIYLGIVTSHREAPFMLRVKQFSRQSGREQSTGQMNFTSYSMSSALGERNCPLCFRVVPR